MFKKIQQQKTINFKDTFFLSLPIELWIHIIKFASAKDILCLFMVSKASHCMMLHDEINKKHILPYQGVPLYFFRKLRVNPDDIPDQIHFLLAGSAEKSDHRSSRGHFYYHVIDTPTPEYIQCDLSTVLYNKKHKLSIHDVHEAMDYPNVLKCFRLNKPTVIIIYPSSVNGLKNIVSKFSPIKKNEIIVVCSSSIELLKKARAMKCKPLLTNKNPSIDENQFILTQCIALISNHEHQNNHKCSLM